MRSRFPEDSLGATILEGKKWSIHERGIAVDKKSIPWKDVEKVYISASSYSVNFIPIGDTRSITIVDSSERKIELAVSASLLNRRSKTKEFSNVYSHILSFVKERQWKEFLQRLQDGQRISFKSFDITQEGIYCADPRIFRSGYDKLEPKRIFGSAIREGVFYIHFINESGKVMERWVDSVKNIPNVHIAQAYFELLRSTYYRQI